MKTTEIKNKIHRTKETTFKFAKEHKNEIAVIGCGIAMITTIVIQHGKICENKKIMAEQILKITKQNDEIDSLKFDKLLKDVEIKRITDLCFEKDEYYKNMMSEAFRHGSSEGARQMAYRKRYLAHQVAV